MNIAQIQYPLYTISEYLTLERRSEERHEYLDGLIYAMAGESSDHGEICTNVAGELYTQLRSKPCRVRSKDTKVCSGPIPNTPRFTKGLYSYPDILVACGNLKFHDVYKDILLNPTVIIEVLSPTTEAYDRGEKFLRYRTYLTSLQDCLVIAQNRPLIEHFTKQDNGQWLLAATITDYKTDLYLKSIDCVLNLTNTYARVEFL